MNFTDFNSYSFTFETIFESRNLWSRSDSTNKCTNGKEFLQNLYLDSRF